MYVQVAVMEDETEEGTGNAQLEHDDLERNDAVEKENSILTDEIIPEYEVATLEGVSLTEDLPEAIDSYEPTPVHEQEHATPAYEPEAAYEATPAYEPETAYEARPAYEPGAEHDATYVHEKEAAFEAIPVYEPEAAYEAPPVYEPEAAYETPPGYEEEAAYDATPYAELESTPNEIFAAMYVASELNNEPVEEAVSEAEAVRVLENAQATIDIPIKESLKREVEMIHESNCVPVPVATFEADTVEDNTLSAEATIEEPLEEAPKIPTESFLVPLLEEGFDVNTSVVSHVLVESTTDSAVDKVPHSASDSTPEAHFEKHPETAFEVKTETVLEVPLLSTIKTAIETATEAAPEESPVLELDTTTLVTPQTPLVAKHNISLNTTYEAESLAALEATLEGVLPIPEQILEPGADAALNVVLQARLDATQESVEILPVEAMLNAPNEESCISVGLTCLESSPDKIDLIVQENVPEKTLEGTTEALPSVKVPVTEEVKEESHRARGSLMGYIRAKTRSLSRDRILNRDARPPKVDTTSSHVVESKPKSTKKWNLFGKKSDVLSEENKDKVDENLVDKNLLLDVGASNVESTTLTNESAAESGAISDREDSQENKLDGQETLKSKDKSEKKKFRLFGAKHGETKKPELASDDKAASTEVVEPRARSKTPKRSLFMKSKDKELNHEKNEEVPQPTETSDEVGKLADPPLVKASTLPRETETANFGESHKVKEHKWFQFVKKADVQDKDVAVAPVIEKEHKWHIFGKKLPPREDLDKKE